jgi:Ca2+-transporting ATPase
MNEDELAEAVKTCDVFSRVIPEHKMKIVRALKKNGEIVAMTGDGVNDAPALKLSDIGIAMGKRGTEVAKEAADMILMDDNFTTIVQSVKDGRRIYDNIRKAMVYIMIIHIPIAGTTLLSPLFNLSQILLPIHIVLLELIIDPTCSIVFEGEVAEPNLMKKPPRSPKEPLLDPIFLWKVILQGICVLAATFFPFHYLVDSGHYSIEIARSFALTTLVFSNIFLVLVNRSNTQYLFKIFSEKQNSARVWINAIAIVILVSLVYVPFLNNVFYTRPLPFILFTEALILGFIATAWWEVVKYFMNRRKV